MGRQGGLRGAIKKQRAKIARRTGKPISRISATRAAQNLGFRFHSADRPKPGFVVRIPHGGTYVQRRPGTFIAADTEKALKLMKKYNPRTGQLDSRRKKAQGQK